MAKAKQLPSGSWRTRVFDYVDENGKKHYKSFTHPDKKESQYLAAEYMRNKDQKTTECTLSFGAALDEYIANREKILSPATVREYKRLRKSDFQSIEDKKICDITQNDIQKIVNIGSETCSPKTVRNTHGLISAVLKVHRPDMVLRTTLPEKRKVETYIPTDADVKKLIEAVSGTEMEIPVLLAAFGPMRRSEIAALTSDCIEGNKVHVKKAMVMDADKIWRIKQPKTHAGDRVITFPDFVIEKLADRNGQIVTINPDAITHRFRRLLKKLELPHFRFHDLRHYGASILHALGIPDQYIMARGGWASDKVLKSVYRHALSDKKDEMTEKANAHFESLV